MYWKYFLNPLKLFEVVDFEAALEKITSWVRILQDTLRICVQSWKADKLQLILGQLVKEETRNMLLPCHIPPTNDFLSSIYNRLNCRQ